MKIALDSSVLVELFARQSPRHAATIATCESLRTQGTEFVLSEHTILEAFSVLSRSPQPIGMSPEHAFHALQDGFGHAMITPMRSGLAWETIRHTLARGHWGGRVYDAVIALSVFEAGASVILTWNPRHFLSIAPSGLEVREPS